MAFIDPAEKKVLVESEAPMHIHKIVLEDEGRRLLAAGHKKFAVFAASQETLPDTGNSEPLE